MKDPNDKPKDAERVKVVKPDARRSAVSLTFQLIDGMIDLKLVDAEEIVKRYKKRDKSLALED